jgi:protein-tyrosine phosphatase
LNHTSPTGKAIPVNTADVTDDRLITSDARLADHPRGRRRAGGIVLLLLLLAGASVAGAYYMRLDRPIDLSHDPEWMTDLTPEMLELLLHPSDRARALPLPGVNNPRDLGGYPTYDGRRVRWGVIFRSGRLRDLTDEGCENFQRLGVVTVVDFRNRMMVDGGDEDADPACVQASADMRLHRFIPPRDKKADDPAHNARRMAARNQQSIVETLRLMADADHLPLLYHCTAGQDRAGMMSFILLELLGVDRRVIRAEYNLSGTIGEVSQYRWINAIFDDIDAAGGIHHYLKAMGLEYRAQKRIRDNLLE